MAGDLPGERARGVDVPGGALAIGCLIGVLREFAGFFFFVFFCGMGAVKWVFFCVLRLRRLELHG